MQSGNSTALDTHHQGHNHPPPKPFSKLMVFLKPESGDIFTVMLFAVTVSILSLATPIAVETLVNTVAFGVLMWPVVVIALVLLACLGLAAAIKAMQIYVIECLQQRLFVRVVSEYTGHIPNIRLEALDDCNGQEMANRFFDVLTLQKSIASLLLDGISILVTVLVGMVVLAFYHPFLLGFDVLMVGLILILLFGLGIGGVRTGLQESMAKYGTAAWLEEMFRCLRTVKGSRGQDLALERANSLSENYLDCRRKHFSVVWRQTVFALGLQVVASTTLLGLGGWLVINRQLTLGQLVAAELIVSVVVSSVAKLGKHAETFFDLLASAEKLSHVLEMPLERQKGEILTPTSLGIAVSYHPEDGESKGPASVSWHVAPNERVALLAPPGFGKTRILEALAGLREISRGRVELDGFDIRNLSLKSLRDQAILVGTPEVFEGSILENLRLGGPYIPSFSLRSALEAVGLMEAINHLPASLETRLTPSGSPLSESQVFELVLARAISQRPRLLLLDGVLDKLDLAESPKLISTLMDPEAPWTLIITTHLPEVAKLCGRSICLGHPANRTKAPGRELPGGGE